MTASILRLGMLSLILHGAAAAAADRLPGHPRLIATPHRIAEIQSLRENDPLLQRMFDRLMRDADVLLDQPPHTVKRKGSGYLRDAREYFRRVTTLALAYRFSGDDRYADRAEAEMLAACRLETWHPSHSLGVAETAAAVALGYDWLHGQLDPASRDEIVERLIQLGCEPLSARDNWWRRRTHNWNSVCHAGQLLAALAVADHDPRWLETAVRDVKSSNVKALEVYEPDGVYPEGPGYWAYGTTYQAILLDALDTALGTDLGLLNGDTAFERTYLYRRHVIGPTGATFSYADLSPFRGAQVGLLWFARRIDNPSAAVDLPAYVGLVQDGPTKEERFYSFSVLWWPDWSKATAGPAPPTSWLGRGPVPVALFRGGWDDADTMFLGVKGGAANANHAHMDNGTFALTADGVRWVQDLGGEHYEPIRKAGFDLFRMEQGSDRWKLLRNHNLYHNTITLDRQEHRIDGHADITHFAPESPGVQPGQAHVDLSATLGLPPRSAERRVVFDSVDRGVRVTDRLTRLPKGTRVDWTLMVFGEPSLADDGRSVVLREAGRSLRIDVNEPSGVRFELTEAKGQHPAEAENPGIRRLFLSFTPPASDALIDVELRPGEE